jgi:hypothetical protein
LDSLSISFSSWGKSFGDEVKQGVPLDLRVSQVEELWNGWWVYQQYYVGWVWV